MTNSNRMIRQKLRCLWRKEIVCQYLFIGSIVVFCREWVLNSFDCFHRLFLQTFFQIEYRLGITQNFNRFIRRDNCLVLTYHRMIRRCYFFDVLLLLELDWEFLLNDLLWSLECNEDMKTEWNNQIKVVYSVFTISTLVYFGDYSKKHICKIINLEMCQFCAMCKSTYKNTF